MTKPQAPDGTGSKGYGSEPQATEPQATEPQATEPHLRLVRGTASPEELSALITVVAALSAAGDDDSDQGGQRRRSSRSLWSAPSRMVGMTNDPGRAGWRASAYPR